MPTKKQIRFVQAIGAGLDREVELLRELLDRTLERVTRQAPEETQLRPPTCGVWHNRTAGLPLVGDNLPRYLSGTALQSLLIESLECAKPTLNQAQRTSTAQNL